VVFVFTLITIEITRRTGVSNALFALMTHDVSVPGLNVGPGRCPPGNIQKCFYLFVSDGSIAQKSADALPADDGLTNAHGLA
jgi:hypothetical protein